LVPMPDASVEPPDGLYGLSANSYALIPKAPTSITIAIQADTDSVLSTSSSAGYRDFWNWRPTRTGTGCPDARADFLAIVRCGLRDLGHTSGPAGRISRATMSPTRSAPTCSKWRQGHAVPSA
jgi:hypothetical protein